MIQEHPLIVSQGLIPSILDDSKNHTRRLTGLEEVNKNPNAWVKPDFGTLGYKAKKSAQGKPGATFRSHEGAFEDKTVHICPQICPYGKVGDILWVREKWQAQNTEGLWWHQVPRNQRNLWNWAFTNPCQPAYESKPPRWIPSIHMPRMACRILLKIQDIRVERIQDISIEDCKREGVGYDLTEVGYRYSFGQLWNQLNQKRDYGWDVNPWVWVIEFARIGEKNEIPR